MDSKDDKHLVGGEPLRPEEQTSGQFVIDNFIGSFRDVSFTNSTKENEPHQVKEGKIVKSSTLSKLDKDLETFQQENSRMIELLMSGEVSVKQLQDYFSTMDKEWERVIPEINKENEVKYGYAKSGYHEHYNLRHLGWIEKMRRQDERELNIGTLNVPLDVNTWRDDQKRELFAKREIYSYIENPKDFYKFAGYLKNNCSLYRRGEKPTNEFDDCPCIQSTVLSRDQKKKRTPLHVAVASNLYHFLENLTNLARVNPHAEWLIFRWMFERRDSKGGLVAQNDGFNIFFELIASCDGDISQTWDLLLAPGGPFYVLTFSSAFQDSLFNKGISNVIYTPEYLSCPYIECGITYLLIQGHVKQAYELFLNYYQSVSRQVVPGLLVEVFRTVHGQEYVNLFSNAILEWTKLDRYRSASLKDLLYPVSLSKRYRKPDSFIHAIIRRGEIEMITAALELIKRVYHERIKINNIYIANQMNSSIGAQKMLPPYEDELQDLEMVVNMEELNPIEFAIEQSEADMVECLKLFGMQYHEKYEYLQWYADLMNGNNNADGDSHIGQLMDHYPNLHALTFSVTVERDDLTEKILYFYHTTEYTDVRVDDLNQALMSALYPRTKIKAPENSSLNRDKLVDIVAMLLLAGATLEGLPWYQGIKSIPKNVPSSVVHLITDVFKARKKKSFERSFRLIEDAYNEVFTYFEIPRVRTEE